MTLMRKPMYLPKNVINVVKQVHSLYLLSTSLFITFQETSMKLVAFLLYLLSHTSMSEYCWLVSAVKKKTKLTISGDLLTPGSLQGFDK